MKEQDFEDLLSGKKHRESEKSLQDLFKEYYAKAKTIDTKDYVNSAKTSLNSFSSILEKRRQRFAKKEASEEGKAQTGEAQQKKPEASSTDKF